MRVLLIVPAKRYPLEYPSFMSNADFPVGFAYLASALKAAGHAVLGLNPNNDPRFTSAHEMVSHKVRHALRKHQPQLIGIGGLCTEVTFLADTLRLIRECAPDVPVVCGGGIINNDGDFIFRTLRPDFAITGEAEEILVQLADMLENGATNYEKIPNLYYWLDNIPQFTGYDLNYIDLDQRPFPDYTPFDIDEMMDQYSLAARYLYRYTRPNARPMTIVGARGCPFSCSFCVHNRKGKYRARSTASIVEEIRFLHERYNFNILVVLDELFAVNKTRFKELCTALIDARKTWGWDFDWLFQTHANARLDLECLQLAKRAGCYCFSYGMESASPRVLASMNKRIKPSQLSEAIELAHEAEIGFAGNFIFGDIAETAESISETLSFYSRNCLDDHVYLSDVRPYPGSRLFNDCLERGIIADKLEYYETIDRVRFKMTSMPGDQWNIWLGQILALGSFPLVKCVDATRIVREGPDVGRAMTQGGRAAVWRFSARCPHCSREVEYQEVVIEESVRRSGLIITTGCPHCNRRLRINVPVERAPASLLAPGEGRHIHHNEGT